MAPEIMGAVIAAAIAAVTGFVAWVIRQRWSDQLRMAEYDKRISILEEGICTKEDVRLIIKDENTDLIHALSILTEKIDKLREDQKDIQLAMARRRETVAGEDQG